MKLKSILVPFQDIKKHGLKKGLRIYLAFNIRHNIIRFFPEWADRIVSRRKGECKNCGDCCSNCPERINNKCSVYDKRRELGYLNCIYCPFPIDLKWNFKFKNCGFYYGKKIECQMTRIEKLK